MERTTWLCIGRRWNCAQCYIWLQRWNVLLGYVLGVNGTALNATLGFNDGTYLEMILVSTMERTTWLCSGRQWNCAQCYTQLQRWNVLLGYVLGVDGTALNATFGFNDGTYYLTMHWASMELRSMLHSASTMELTTW